MTTIDNKDITRYPEWNLIVSLSIYYKEITPYVNYYCENNHKGEISLEQYLEKINNYSLFLKKNVQNAIKSRVKQMGMEIFLIVVNVINSYAIRV